MTAEIELLSNRSGSVSAIRRPCAVAVVAIVWRRGCSLSTIEPGLSVLQRTGRYGMPVAREDSSQKPSESSNLVDGAQEVARFAPWMMRQVVGGGQSDQFADAQLGDAFLAGALKPRVFHGAHADDGAPAGHQPRHRMHVPMVPDWS